ncbi:MAG: glycosyltransferase, partial [Candidatus Competibacteraceae bacterium]|nr:glycosyltransferase [Candidatus Competibacteraceae bacterium]
CLVIIGKLSNQQRIALQKYDINFENHVGISRNEMVSQYQQADILIFVSLYEGFGLPILEANAVGRPVITSNLYSMPEVGGDAACYVNPYKVTDIRSAIEKIINDVSYRNKLIDNGFRNVKRFRSDAIANQYAALYRALDKQEA